MSSLSKAASRGFLTTLSLYFLYWSDRTFINSSKRSTIGYKSKFDRSTGARLNNVDSKRALLASSTIYVSSSGVSISSIADKT
jgi:hypothetical protein